jgi:hypothetical protein
VFREIRTNQDIQDFLEKSNCLHDGYIIDAHYTNQGISKIENGHYFEPDKTKLILQILVTSIWDTVVEIEFEGLFEWQIKDSQSNIFHTSVTFDEHNRIVWSDDAYINTDEVRKGSYAVASSMKWRIVK